VLYMVIRSYESSSPDPIVLRKGERVILGQTYEGEENWPHWVFCSKPDRSQGGWVPEQIISRGIEDGVIKENYSAKELTMAENEVVQGLKELNGWVWCKRLNNHEIGWFPKDNLKELT